MLHFPILIIRLRKKNFTKEISFACAINFITSDSTPAEFFFFFDSMIKIAKRWTSIIVNNEFFKQDELLIFYDNKYNNS